MNLRKIATLVGGAGLTLSLIGAGVGASFNASSSVNQTVNVGSMSIALTSSTPGAVINGDGTITCPTFLAVTQSGWTDCQFTITSTGSITPSSVTVSVTEAGASAAEITHQKFAAMGIVPFLGTQISLTTSPQTVETFTAAQLPAAVTMRFEWGVMGPPSVLDNTDSGASVTVTYAILAVS